MNGNMFNSDQVLAVGQALWDSEGESRGSGIKSDSIAGDGSCAPLPYTEPHGARAIESSCSAWGFGHVDVERTGVEDRNIGLKTDGRPGGHGDGRGGGCRSETADIAAHVIRGHIHYGRVGVGVRTDTDVFGTDSSGIDELEEPV